jgi:two-component system sensor histidine kinase YesM
MLMALSTFSAHPTTLTEVPQVRSRAEMLLRIGSSSSAMQTVYIMASFSSQGIVYSRKRLFGRRNFMKNDRVGALCCVCGGGMPPLNTPRTVRNILKIFLDGIKKTNLRRKVLLVISSTVLVIFFFCFLVYGRVILARSRRDKEQSIRNYIAHTEDQLNAYLSQIDFLAHTVIFSSWVQQLVGGRSTSVTELLHYRANVQSFLQNLAGINNDISMVLITDREMIFTNPLQRYDPWYKIQNQDWFPKLVADKKYREYGSSKLFSSLSGGWSLTIFYVITDIYNFDNIGYFAINIPVEKFSFLLDENQYDWIEITASNGNVILDGPSYLIEDKMLSEKLKKQLQKPESYDLILFETTLMNGHWNIRIYRHFFDISPSEIRYYYFFFALMIPVLGIFVVIVIVSSRYLTNPIVKCRNAMLEIQNDNFGITLENRYRDEIGGLISGFNEMSLTLASLHRKNAEIEKLRREAEIAALQQKVNPHFLYNTLEVINSFILDGKYDEAVRECELLGQIYHYNLMSNKWVLLKDECEYIKRYLEIFQYKLNNFSVIWEVEEKILNAKFLRLSLQPLVENAILHGLRSKQVDACLTILAKSPIESDRLEVCVMDNGSGFQPAALAKLTEVFFSIRREISPNGPHIGLPNVYQRLYLEYGEAMQFVIESRPGHGTKITMTLPLEMM